MSGRQQEMGGKPDQRNDSAIIPKPLQSIPANDIEQQFYGQIACYCRGCSPRNKAQHLSRQWPGVPKLSSARASVSWFSGSSSIKVHLSQQKQK